MVADPAARARSVTAVTLPQASALRQFTENHLGLTLGVGLGAAQPEHALRIAHMGHASGQQILGALAGIEAAMLALDIPHQPGGTTAAAAVLARLAGSAAD